MLTLSLRDESLFIAIISYTNIYFDQSLDHYCLQLYHSFIISQTTVVVTHTNALDQVIKKFGATQYEK